MAIAAELTRLKGKQLGVTGVDDVAFGTTSILFDVKKASSAPLEDIAALGANGALHLSRLDRRFVELAGILFSGKVVDRQVLEKEKLQAVESAVQKFCLLASPFFLLPPTQKCIEWLLRGWSSADFPSDIHHLALLAVPYHETPQCARLLYVLLGRGDRGAIASLVTSCWEPLRKAASEGKYIPRKTLGRLPVTFFHEIAKVAARSAKGNVQSSTLLSFYTSLVCERLAEDSPVDESFMKTLFLDATEGLSLKLSRSIPHNEYRMACIVVISSLVQRKGTGAEVLSDGAFKSAGEYIAKILSEEPESAEQSPLAKASLLCLVALCSAANVKELPENVFRFLVKCKGLGKNTTEAKRSYGNGVAPLVTAFATSAAKNAHRNRHYFGSFEDFLETAPLDQKFVDTMTMFLDSYATVACAESSWGLGSSVDQLLHKLARSAHLEYLDAAASTFLSQRSGANEDLVKSQIVKAFVNSSLQQFSSGMQSSGIGDQTSLLSGLESPNPEIRLEGTKLLNEESKKAELPEEFVRAAIFGRILDDDLSVRCEALKNERLRSEHYASQVLNALEPLLTEAATCSQGPRKQYVEHMMRLVGYYAGLDGPDRHRALSLLLRYLVIPRSKATRRKFQKPAIEGLGGLYVEVGDACRGMPRSTTAGELDLCYAEKPLAKALAKAAQHSEPFLSLLKRTFALRWKSIGESDREEVWWWLWIGKQLSSNDSTRLEQTPELALSALEACCPLEYSPDQTEAIAEVEELDVQLEKASNGDSRSLAVACARVFLDFGMHEQSLSSDLISRAYDVFLSRGRFRELQELLNFEYFKTGNNREVFLRTAIYTKDATAACMSLGIFVAHVVSTGDHTSKSLAPMVADVLLFATSPNSQKRSAAATSAAFLLKSMEGVRRPSAAVKSTKQLLSEVAQLLPRKKTMGSGKLISAVERAISSVHSELRMGLFFEAGKELIPGRTEGLLHMCSKAFAKIDVDEFRACVGLLQSDDQAWTRSRILVLGMIKDESITPVLENDLENCQQQLLSIACTCKTPELQIAALEAIGRVFPASSGVLRERLVLAWCRVLGGQGSLEGTAMAKPIAHMLGGITAEDLTKILAGFHTHLQKKNWSAKKRKSEPAVEQENEISARTIDALLESIQDSDSMQKIIGSKDLVKPLFDLLSELTTALKEDEDTEERLYVVQTSLSCLNTILSAERGRSNLIKVSDVRLLMGLFNSEDVPIRVRSLAATELVATIATQFPAKVGPEIISFVRHMITDTKYHSRDTTLSSITRVVKPLVDTKVSLDALMVEVVEGAAEIEERRLRQEVLAAAVDCIGADVALVKVIELWGDQEGEKKASFFDVLGSYSCTEQQAAMIRFMRECQGKPAEEMHAGIVTVGEYLGSPTFLSSVEDFLGEESGLVQQNFQDMIEVLLLSKEKDVKENTRTDVIDNVLETVITLISTTQFCQCLEKLLATSVAEKKLEALEAFTKRVEISELLVVSGDRDADQAQLYARIFKELPDLMLNRNSAPTLVQAVITAIDKCCLNVSSGNQGLLAPLMKPVLEIAQSEDVELSCSAILCIQSLLITLQAKCVPIVPGTLAVLAKRMSANVEEQDESLNKRERKSVHEACVLTIDSMLYSVPQFFSGKNFEIIFQSMLEDSVYSLATTKQVLEGFAQKCEPRFFLPAVSAAMGSYFREARGSTAESAVAQMERLLNCLNYFIEVADKSNIRKHRLDVVLMIFRSAELRRRLRLKTETRAESFEGFVGRAEMMAITCFVSLAMKLREVDFRDVFDKFLEWSEGSGRCLSDAVGKELSSTQKYLDRSIVLQKCLCELLERVQVLFAPFVTPLLDRTMELLVGLPEDQLAKLNTDSQSSRKRKRKSVDKSSHLTTQLKTATESSLRMLGLYFTFTEDTVSDRVFDKTLEALVEVLELPRMNGDVVKNAIASFASRSFKNAKEESEGSRRLSTVNRLVILKVRTNNSSLRLQVTECILAIAQRLGEAYLPCLPEAMSFLADLIDDEDLEVEAKARELGQLLEELSGEPILAQLKE
ncbi:hypothetical protein NDN08_001817 [Rhodosorus marinus]|uniref:HEAT repeat-containing protein 1 n=1 Tax=Rhodosorus marinus TaxID=101924 RepID=A0AAV8URX5_9RHOD|nr:hypothetical protein NDN08_001817 [Rhodosorus marinus]